MDCMIRNDLILGAGHYLFLRAVQDGAYFGFDI